ncbi:MAG: hypothetical protein JW891_11475 [Candidatus Lokiarchaeota archaeon]|nr:hypothetical protein [Candidatus Lokiarchaeota archaeon]
MKNLKLTGLKYSTGKYELFKERFVFFPPQIIDILASIYGEGVVSLLVWLGKRAGRDLIQNWETSMKPKTLKDLTNLFISTLSQLGWGKFEVKNVSEQEIVISHKENVAKELENPQKFMCYFIKGMLVGFGEYAIYKPNSRIMVTETQCVIDDPNAKSCEYIIVRS